MGMPGNGHPALGVSRVEELPMAALLAAHHPTFALEPFEDLPHLHALMLARRVGTSIRRTLLFSDRRPQGCRMIGHATKMLLRNVLSSGKLRVGLIAYHRADATEGAGVGTSGSPVHAAPSYDCSYGSGVCR